jgi:hypothetical protein
MIAGEQPVTAKVYSSLGEERAERKCGCGGKERMAVVEYGEYGVGY